MMYTVKEVAEILKLHFRTVERLVREGKIRSVKIGGAYRITEEEVERIKKEGTG